MEGQNHILFISSWYPNRNNPTHGIFNKAFALAASRHNKISVLHVCSDETLRRELETVQTTEDNITTVTVYYRKVATRIPLLAHLQKRNRLLRAFDLGYHKLVAQTGKPDLVQLNVVLPAGLGAYYLAGKYGLPYVINEGWSGYCPEDGNYSGPLMKYFTKKIIAKAQVLMPVSEHLKKAMLAHGLQGHYNIVSNVVDTELFLPVPARVHAGLSFIHISTLDDVQKNVSGILRAFGIASRQDSEMELSIVGDGPGRPGLEQLAQQLGISEKIIFKGRLVGKPLAAELNRHDALVMFSNYETFCLTVAEALACGKPVITSRAGGLTDHITPELGLTVNKKDEAALAKSFLHFKTAMPDFDPERLRQFITARFTPEKIGRQLTGIYDSVLHKTSV